jgi:CPA1 family monovalent cation:H+ antiporter
VSAFQTVAAVLAVASLFAYVNQRWIRLPVAIALMALALGASLLLLLLDRLGLLRVTSAATEILQTVKLDRTLLHGVLGVMLFAGALHIDLGELREQRLAIGTLAMGATLLSTVLVGLFTWAIVGLLGIDLSLSYCMLFGALISPTDPIAVMDILRAARVPRRLEIVIAGESLFNDGVGVVIFVTVMAVASGGHATAGKVLQLFVREAVGGTLFGLVLGYGTYQLLRTIDHYQTEILLTLALVLGGYALAEWLHLSAPLTAVAAGIVIGNQGRAYGMSDLTRDNLDRFWSLVDYILNALLFVLVGFEVIRLQVTGRAFAAGLAMIPAVLLARLVSVALPVVAQSPARRLPRGALPILTWGGLRGAISVALALSIPAGPAHDVTVTMTYFVVTFSVLAQGLTLGRFARQWGDSTD